MARASVSKLQTPKAKVGHPIDPWVRYQSNLARHLMGISRDLESRVMRSLEEEAGYDSLRPSVGPFLSLLWGEGQSLSVIADELAISKQATSQLANLCEEAGYVERRSHPTDGRSKMIALTARGHRLVGEGIRLILEVEAEYKTLLTATAYRQFTWALADLFRGLGLPMSTDPELASTASQSVGVLPMIAVRIQRELMQLTIERGHPGLKMSHGQVLPLIGSDGGRIAEIARIQGVSRQAISTISQDLESLGYLSRESDPTDRRGVLLRLTVEGRALIEDSVVALDDLETSFRRILGARGLSRLKRAAKDIYQALRLETAIFDSGSTDRSPRRIDPPSAFASDAAHARKLDSAQLRELASKLRNELGSGDAARLAALLEA